MGAVVHVSGLEFADKQTPTDQRAEVLIDKINWILSFYGAASRESSERGEPSTNGTKPRPRSRRSR
jgi:hypothetical protein